MPFVVIGVMGRTIIISKVNATVLKLLWRMFIPLWPGGNKAVPMVVLPVSVEFKFCLCVLEGLPAASLKHKPGTRQDCEWVHCLMVHKNVKYLGHSGALYL